MVLETFTTESFPGTLTAEPLRGGHPLARFRVADHRPAGEPANRFRRFSQFVGERVQGSRV